MGYISKKQPKQYVPPAVNHARCKKPNCTKCMELEECLPHIETPPREKYEFPGAEQELIDTYGRNE